MWIGLTFASDSVRFPQPAEGHAGRCGGWRITDTQEKCPFQPGVKVLEIMADILENQPGYGQDERSSQNTKYGHPVD